MIVGIYKIRFKEINFKYTVYIYNFNILVKTKKLETKNILNFEKNNDKDFTFFLLDMTVEIK